MFSWIKSWVTKSLSIRRLAFEFPKTEVLVIMVGMKKVQALLSVMFKVLCSRGWVFKCKMLGVTDRNALGHGRFMCVGKRKCEFLVANAANVLDFKSSFPSFHNSLHNSLHNLSIRMNFKTLCYVCNNYQRLACFIKSFLCDNFQTCFLMTKIWSNVSNLDKNHQRSTSKLYNPCYDLNHHQNSKDSFDSPNHWQEISTKMLKILN